MKKRIFIFITFILLLLILTTKGDFWDDVAQNGNMVVDWTKYQALDGWGKTKALTDDWIDEAKD